MKKFFILGMTAMALSSSALAAWKCSNGLGGNYQFFDNMTYTYSGPLTPGGFPVNGSGTVSGYIPFHAFNIQSSIGFWACSATGQPTTPGFGTYACSGPGGVVYLSCYL